MHVRLDVGKEEEEEDAKGHLPVQYVYVSFITVVLYYLDILNNIDTEQWNPTNASLDSIDVLSCG